MPHIKKPRFFRGGASAWRRDEAGAGLALYLGLWPLPNTRLTLPPAPTLPPADAAADAEYDVA